MKKFSFVLLFLLILSLVSIYAQSSGLDVMRSGLDKFKAGGYSEALLDFREVILDTGAKDYHGSAYFWITKCYLAKSDLKQAGDNLDFFLANFMGHPFMEEGFYQKGRIEFLKGAFENAVGDFYSFINQYPESDYVPNSYYWIGESLYSLGHYDEAEKIFGHLISEYPTSYKLEAANYRMALIDLIRREEVLMDLVKLSHEEYVTSLEEFQRKERSYEQAISSYQRRISQLESRISRSEEEKNVALQAVKDEMQALLDQASLDLTAAKDAQVVQVQPTTPAVDRTDAPEANLTEKGELLNMKERVLEVKDYLTDLLLEQYQGGM